MSGPQRHYLLVDDNRPLAENLAEILRDEGHQVDVVDRGAAALERVKAHRFDALLTDMRMPVMDGAELVHQVRQVDPGLPALVFTAYAGDEALRLARDEGLLAVIAKPVPVARLLELLAHARRDGMLVVVEDDPAMSDNLAEVLLNRGFTAIASRSAIDTGRIGQIKPFAALVDLVVPGGTFGASMQQLESRFPGLPLIVITAHDEQPPPRPCRALFKKPFDTAQVMALLEQLYLERRP